MLTVNNFYFSVAAILPELSNPLSPRRFLLLAKNANPERMHFILLLKVLVIMLAEIIALEDDACVINGQEVVFDCQGAHYSYIAQTTPSVLKNFVAFSRKALATRIIGVHFINVASYILPVVTLFKSLLPGKIKDRVSLLNIGVHIKDL